MKIRIKALDGSFYEVEESRLQAYKVPAEEVARQLQYLKGSLRLDLARELGAQPSKRRRRERR